MTTLNEVKEFLGQKHIAIAGISRKPQKFGNAIFKELSKKNYHLYPIHREMVNYEGMKCYPDVNALPPEVSALIICTQPAQTTGLVKQPSPGISGRYGFSRVLKMKKVSAWQPKIT